MFVDVLTFIAYAIMGSIGLVNIDAKTCYGYEKILPFLLFNFLSRHADLHPIIYMHLGSEFEGDSK